MEFYLLLECVLGKFFEIDEFLLFDVYSYMYFYKISISIKKKSFPNSDISSLLREAVKITKNGKTWEIFPLIWDCQSENNESKVG